MTKKEPGFEQQLTKLEEIVQQLDSEDIPLEKAIALYESGVKLSLKLNQTLDSFQRKIEILTQNEQGELTVQAFEEQDNRNDG